jgi:transposase InsO family protein
MIGEQNSEPQLFNYAVNLEKRVRAAHPLRRVKATIDFGFVREEVVYHHRFATRAQARTAVFDYIETSYNRTRLHSSLDYQSPINFESKLN